MFELLVVCLCVRECCLEVGDLTVEVGVFLVGEVAVVGEEGGVKGVEGVCVCECGF